MDILGPVFWLLVALGLLVTFHEFGHFWVARRCGVRVLTFSVGFGRALFSRTARDGTCYQVAAIPLGGYVKMLDEREQTVTPEHQHEAFNRKPVGQRMAIVAAGPVFNLIFAVAAFWLMFVVGVPETRPVLGPTTGLAAEAGLNEGDMITHVDGRRADSWTHAMLGLMKPALDRRETTVEVENRSGATRSVRLPLGQLGPDFNEEDTLEHLGMQPWRPPLPPRIGEVQAGSAADAAGLAAGDRLVSIGDEPVSDWRDIATLIPAQALDENGEVRTIDLTVERDGRVLERSITPALDQGRPVIGIQAPPPDAATQAEMQRAFVVLRHGPVEALGQAVGETWRLTTATLGILGRMITGKASLSNLSGPITIAQMADSSAQLGLSRFLFFLGLISLSLAIINLMPIPMLDGGHLLYYTVEVIKGSPVSESIQIAGQYLGLVMVLGLMSLAIFNDILRLIT
ncbi:RIP metalloprotease RseP [Wenzhouxiangella limi]|uniref:Zinc metalloprotease n=1 Tax=Wenzhouxiangella limi TaxID=2707351 RepID=A0A845UWG2_9GAMM|nr:RIP metalloprotease RseP [Wenzhouxiangella limi]NDY94938.1 RIP metalloprotease RseP [Wenzhouxiangella limi]